LAHGQGIGEKLKKSKHVSICIDEEVLQKFHYVAKYENRFASGQIMFLINNCIRDFEKKTVKLNYWKKQNDKGLHNASLLKSFDIVFRCFQGDIRTVSVTPEPSP